MSLSSIYIWYLSKQPSKNELERSKNDHYWTGEYDQLSASGIGRTKYKDHRFGKEYFFSKSLLDDATSHEIKFRWIWRCLLVLRLWWQMTRQILASAKQFCNWQVILLGRNRHIHRIIDWDESSRLLHLQLHFWVPFDQRWRYKNLLEVSVKGKEISLF